MDEKEQKLFAAILGQLIRISDALEAIARAGEPAEPNLVKPLDEFSSFDWSSIGASAVHQDQDGPTHLEWGGYVWTRRSPSNKYDPAIWYSRAAGRDAEGNVRYLRLITFRKVGEAEPVPEKAKQSGSKRAAESGKGPDKNQDKEPDRKAWEAWRALADRAAVLGIQAPAIQDKITMEDLRREYGQLQVKVREAEGKIPA